MLSAGAVSTCAVVTAAAEDPRERAGACEVVIGGRTITAGTHVIALPGGATPEEQYAARELQRHLRLITGETTAIVPETQRADRVPLAVGRCDLVRALAPEIDVAGLGIEGIHIRTVGPALILAGNKRGVIYATCTFLEDYLGCRWFSEDCATWPTKGRIEVPDVNRRYIPPLEYRDICWPFGMPLQFGVRNKLNGPSFDRDDVPGGCIKYSGFVHTFSSLLPPERYFDEHPEYFSLVDGERQKDGTQLCLTEPDVLRIATEAVRQRIENAGGAVIVSVSQNDNGNYCQCEGCTALAQKEGSQSGPIIHFVNAIADDIAPDYPDVLIDTLAYRYSRRPPRHVRPRPNVCVRLCSIECVFQSPIEAHPFNASFREDMLGWAKICDRLYVWDYVVNFHHALLPHPNLYVLQPNISFFVRNGARGVFEAACYYTRGAELAELRRYIVAKALWDPACDTDRAIDEFCRAHYGPAARYVRQYVNLIHDSITRHPGVQLTIGTQPLAGHLDQHLLSRAAALFDRAEQAVRDDPLLLGRVRIARLPVIYAQFSLAEAAPYGEVDGRLIARHDWDVPRLAHEFKAFCEAGSVTRLRETPLSPWAPLLTPSDWLETVTRWPKELKIERIASPALEVLVLPEMGGRIWRARLLATGRDLFRAPGAAGSWHPDRGGYEEYGDVRHRSRGWSERYTVTARGERFIGLLADLPGGLSMSRRIELDPVRPILTIRSSLTNVSDGPQQACLRAHPEFPCVFRDSTVIVVRRTDGTWRRLRVENAAAPYEEGKIWLEGDDVPAGAWGLVDEAEDFAILNRMKRDQVWKCFINSCGAESRVNLELYSPLKTLAPGESLVLEHSYEPGAADAVFGRLPQP